MDPYRYWRWWFTAGVTISSPVLTVSIGEAELMTEIGGLDQTGAGTASADSVTSSYLPANAFANDGDTTHWTSAANYPHWLKYDFGAGQEKAIVQYTLEAPFTAGSPKDWTLQCSNDDATWITVDSRSDYRWDASLFRTFVVGDTTATGIRVNDSVVRLDLEDGGIYRILGTVTELGVAGPYRVRLFDRQSARCIRESWSAADGSYLFDNLADRANGYFVVAYDHGDNPLNAAIADLITPEPMP